MTARTEGDGPDPAQEDTELLVRLHAISEDDQPVGDTWIPMPEGVTPFNVESAVRRVFGEPVEPALDRHPTIGVLQIGWYFAGDRLADFGLPAEGNAALVIPYLVDDGGSATPLYVANALRKQEFVDLIGEDGVSVVDGRVDHGSGPGPAAPPP